MKRFESNRYWHATNSSARQAQPALCFRCT